MEKKRQIVNIVNFIRGAEPRGPIDLHEPVAEQMKLLKKHSLKGTFLFQYNAMHDDFYVNLMKENASDDIELGVWLEMDQMLVEKAGLVWRGRFEWDWHSNVGFSVGYTCAEREKIIDVLMNGFRDIFGYYSKSVGSWTIDAHSLGYLCDKYKISASCNCKDQWGTDGYTIWGGYYNQAYYPSKKNMFSPAQTKKEQIDVPVFRMLGSDPIYQYDFGLDINSGASGCQGVVTLEPVYCGSTGGGGVPEWVDWYLKENFNTKCLAFAYTQAGQENSFGWKAMSKGLIYQFDRIAEMQKNGEVEVITLEEAGEWFKEQFKLTPSTTATAESDWNERGHKSVWYNSKRYRANLYTSGNTFRIRDIYLFDENYEERYNDSVCVKEYLEFDNLPVVDGNRWSGNGILAGLYFTSEGKELTFDEMIYREISDDTAEVTFTDTSCGDVKITLSLDKIKVSAKKAPDMEVRYNPSAKSLPDIVSTSNGNIRLSHRNYVYSIHLTNAEVSSASDKVKISSLNGSDIEICF